MTAEEFKRIFLPCHPRLYRFAFRLTGNREDAEDLVQEAFLKLWNSRERIGEPENPAAFCMTALRNTFVDSVRRRREDSSTIPLDERLTITADNDVGRDIESRDSINMVLSLIDNLPSNQRDIMRMRDIADAPFDEIETVTGLSPGNIRTLLSRARKKIKEQYTALMNYERK